MSTLFDVPIRAKVSVEQLMDILISAIEGGLTAGWCPKIRIGVRVTDRRDDEVNNEWIARNLAEGGTLKVWEDDQVHELTRPMLLDGLARWAQTGRGHWSADGLDTGGDFDAVQADAVLQLALFQEERYA